MNKAPLCISLLLFFSSHLFGDSEKFFNPVTDICWSCMFPLQVAGANLTPKCRDNTTKTDQKKLCHCEGGLVGLPVSFWEPTYIAEITHTPYKMTAFGGMKLGKATHKKQGFVSASKGRGRSSFAHVHLYQYPVLQLLNMTTDFACGGEMEFGVAYMSEFDPFWSDSKWTAVFNPEAALFGNPLAQAACVADCASATIGKAQEKLFWCAGCHGSIYPLSGHVSHHQGGIQASSLLLQRVLHKLTLARSLKTFAPEDFCTKTSSTLVRKNAFRTQLAAPIAQKKGPCNRLGCSSELWGTGKSYPFGGEDFTYVLWTRKQCCLDPVKIAKKTAGGEA